MKKAKAAPKTIVFPIILMVIFVILGVMLIKDQIPLFSNGNAVIKLTNEKSKVKTGETFLVNVHIETDEKGVEAGDFVVKYDPLFVSVEDQRTGGFFPNFPINTNKDNYVKFSGMAGFDGKKVTIPNGKGNIGIISFKAIKQGKTIIALDKTKTVAAKAGKDISNKRRMNEIKIDIE